MDAMDVTQFCDYIAENFDEEVSDSFKRNKISGSVFLRLSEGQLGRMVEAIGDVVELQSLQSKHNNHESADCEDLHSVASDHHTASLYPQSEDDIDSLTALSPAPASTMSRSSVHEQTNLTQSDSPPNPPMDDFSRSNCDWVKNFHIPTQFSLRTMKAIQTKQKSEITRAIRCEIISSVATLVMVHTMYPTPEEYTVIASNLISVHPILADKFGCGYTTWRNKLKEKFKNLRKKRGRRTDEEDNPPSKRQCGIDIVEHNNYIATLKKEMTKRKPKSAVVNECMDNTSERRRKWIMEDGPCIANVLQEYPSLRFSKWVRREFSYIVNCEDVTGLVGGWVQTWEPKILKLGDKESESSKSLKTKLSEASNSCHKALLVLEHLLVNRAGKGGTKSILIFEEYGDIEEITNKYNINVPYIIGIPSEDDFLYNLIIDGVFMYTCTTLHTLLFDLLFYYYVLNMSYPKHMHAFFIFFQHYILELECSKLPTSVLTLINNL